MRMVSLLLGMVLFKLEISCRGDRRIAQLLQHRLQPKGLCPEGNHIQNEIHVFGALCLLDGELDGLRAGKDEIVLPVTRAPRIIPASRFARVRNHASLQRGSIALLNK
jgi:hypothetical protein